jgi:hypothetical protein
MSGGTVAPPLMHVGWLVLAAVPSAILIYGIELVVNRFPDAGWLARLHTPRWTTLEPFFKGSKILLPLVALSYVLFYVTQGLYDNTAWAVWVNKHLFYFYLFCRRFSAVEVVRIEIGGYVLYLVLYAIYNCYCPPILAHSIRKEGTLTREDTALVFVRTIERHGQAIPPADLGRTVVGFATEQRGLFDDDTKELLDGRIEQLERVIAEQPPATAAVVADAAAVARLFPTRLAIETYHLGVSLFDILYPAVRAALCVGLAVAILATSLPVAAKLLWVVLPRLGEPCMTDTMMVPPDFRDSEWVEFEGKVSLRGPDLVLIPADNANERWTLSSKDVLELPIGKPSRIFVRIGSEVKDIKLVGLPSGNAPPPGLPSRMSIQCGAAGSRCSNHIEICCGSNVVKGECYGQWACPRP